MERGEEDGRIDVAFVVGAVHGGAVEREMFGAGDLEPDAAKPEAQVDAAVPEHVQQAGPAEQRGQQHPEEAGHEHVEGNGDVGDRGADRGDEHGGSS